MKNIVYLVKFDIDENNKCRKCGMNMNERKYTNNELFSLEKNLKENINQEFQEYFNEIKKYKKSRKEKVAIKELLKI